MSNRKIFIKVFYKLFLNIIIVMLVFRLIGESMFNSFAIFYFICMLQKKDMDKILEEANQSYSGD